MPSRKMLREADVLHRGRHSRLSSLERLFDTGPSPGSRPAGVTVGEPLAARMRPRSLDEFAGQEHLLGGGSALRTAIESGALHSMVLYGPPGSGKTTLARIAASQTGAVFEEASAVQAGRAEVRAVIERAAHRRSANGSSTIFFLDEIHRFNKAQQDALLPAVEEGLVILIGATTENPYFEVNSALLSRAQIYELRPLTQQQVSELLRRASTTRARDRRSAAGRRRRARVPRGSIGRRRARRLQRARAGLRDGCRAQTAGHARAGRRRDAEAGGPLRQGRRQALRLHLGLDQGDARLRRTPRSITSP